MVSLSASIKDVVRESYPTGASKSGVTAPVVESAHPLKTTRKAGGGSSCFEKPRSSRA
jgi:hypothetical protein